jgi:BirA family biotin operon repressor/biotin-[acetyl-CoA-carboxylase] ligase
VRDALAPHIGATIKWPNDVLIEKKKVCGVLVENRLGRTVVGIGINVHHQADDFPPELQDRATSVERATGKPIDRGVLLRDVLTRLDERVMVIRSGGCDRVYEEWAEACGIIGKRIHCGTLEGAVTSVDRDGALVVATPLGPRRILLGEVVELEGA